MCFSAKQSHQSVTPLPVMKKTSGVFSSVCNLRSSGNTRPKQVCITFTHYMFEISKTKIALDPIV